MGLLAGRVHCSNHFLHLGQRVGFRLKLNPSWIQIPTELESSRVKSGFDENSGFNTSLVQQNSGLMREVGSKILDPVEFSPTKHGFDERSHH